MNTLKDSIELIISIINSLDIVGSIKNSGYISYIGLGLLVFIIYFIIRKIIQKRNENEEYIEDPLFFEIKPSSLEDPLELIQNTLDMVYKKITPRFHSKYPISIEILLSKKSGKKYFLKIPKKIYNTIGLNLPKDKFVMINDFTDRMFSKKDGKGIATFELEKDFVYPLSTLEKEEINIPLKENEFLYLQIVLRPAGLKWNRILDAYIGNLNSGKDVFPVPKGFFGGCLSIVYPVMSLFAGMFSSAVSKDIVVSREGSKKDNLYSEKLASISNKKSIAGFESAIRMLISAQSSEKMYWLLNGIQNKLAAKEKYVNGLLTREVIEKIGSDERIDFKYSFIPSDSIDVINHKEAASIINMFR